MSCLDVDRAMAYLAGDLDREAADRCAAHLSECAGCCDLMRETSELIDEVRQDLLVLDTALPDAPLLPVDRIMERSRRGALNPVRVVGRIGTVFTEDTIPAPVASRIPTPRLRRAATGIALLLVFVTWLGIDSASAAAARIRHTFVQIVEYLSGSAVTPTPLASTPSAPARSAAPAPAAPAKPAATPRAVVTRPSDSTVRPTRTVGASLARQELAAWHQLHALGLLLGGEATVGRSDRSVTVSIAVAGDARRAAVEAAFSRVPEPNRPTLERRSPRVEAPAADVVHSSPLFLRLREHFAALPQSAAVAEEYAASVLTTSRRLGERTASLRQFLEAFPVGRLAGLDLDAAAQWRHVTRDHALEIGAIAATLRQHLAMVPAADQREASVAIDALSSAQPALEDYLRRADEATALLDRARAGGESSAVLESLVATLQRVTDGAERFSGPWDLSR